MSTRKRLNEKHRRRKHRNVVYAAIAAVLAIAAIAAVALSRPNRASSETKQVRPVTTTGNPLPTFEAAKSDPAIGMTIPAVSGTSFDGKPVGITNDGKAKVVMFVAHWCPHCRKEVPLLANDLRQSPLPATVEMITVSTGVNSSAPNYPPSKWLAAVDWPTRVIVDDSRSRAAAAYGLTAYPYFVFVDANGEVQYRASGEMSLAEFRQHVAAIQAR